MTCTAQPGFYCSLNRILACEEKFYCLGGSNPAIQCLKGKWSPAQSTSIDACIEHFDYMLWWGIAFVFLLMICIYLSCYCNWQFDRQFDTSRSDYGPRYVLVHQGYCSNQPLCPAQQTRTDAACFPNQNVNGPPACFSNQNVRNDGNVQPV